MPELIAVARDQDLKVFWSTMSFRTALAPAIEAIDLTGTSLKDIYSVSLARARERMHREIMATGKARSLFIVVADTKMLCTVFPLDEVAFGHKGVLVIIREASLGISHLHGQNLPVQSIPDLDRLVSLSPRELEVLHHIAKGMSTNEIAETVSRSSKTVEKQVNSIHTKLGTRSRPELVRFASERGIQTFTSDQWSQIVQGAKVARRELNRPNNN